MGIGSALFCAWHEGSGISACEKSLEWQRSLQLMLKLLQRSLEGNPGFNKKSQKGMKVAALEKCQNDLFVRNKKLKLKRCP